MTDLEPISPEEAVDWYIKDKKEDWSYETRRSNSNGLDVFLDWTEEHGLENMNNLTGRKLMRFKTWRKNEDIKKISLNGNLSTLHAFLNFCVAIEAVEEIIPHKVPFPEVSEEEEVRDESPDKAHVEAVLNHLETYHYASREHVGNQMIEELGIRSGACRAIDEGDFRPEDNVIELRHRPEGIDERGTPLKNGKDSERNLNLSNSLCELIQNYMNNPERPECDDDRYGRNPLFTSEDSEGNVDRIDVGRIRGDYYRFTRPCQIGLECPGGRNPNECKAAKNRYAYKCDYTYTTHPLRTYSIMKQLDKGIPLEFLSDRTDVSEPVLKKHYDRRENERKQKRRLEVLEGILPDYGDKSDTNPMSDSMSVFFGPLAWAGFASYALAKWTLNRLGRELSHLSPPPTGVPIPSRQKAARASVLYCLFVLLLGLDLAVLGTFG